MNFIEKIRSKAKENLKTIVMPEGEEPRMIEAAAFLQKENLVTPVLLGNPQIINDKAKELNADLSNIRIIEPASAAESDDFANEYYELRKHKGMTPEDAKKTVQDPLFFGAFMLRRGMVDSAVAGSINATGNVLRAAIQVVGLAEGIKVVSSSFAMILKDGREFTFADCAVIPDPDEEQLASIAISSTHTHQGLIGSEPNVAMLSFSTKGSASHPAVDKVVNALNIVKQKAPEINIDGELQFDAALLESVGQRKAPESPVAGKANVFIFPDLNSANIGYKIAQRLGDAEAIGPTIQGLAKPYNDLSRGCSVDDIINVACICSILS
jgi:phosphate acetyltransferase